MIKYYICKTLEEKLLLLETYFRRGYSAESVVDRTIEGYFEECGSTRHTTMSHNIIVLNEDKREFTFYLRTHITNYADEVTLHELMNPFSFNKGFKKHKLV